MSYVAQRAVVSTRTRLHDVTGSAPGLATTAVLAALGVLVALQWWERGVALPASWGMPPLTALLLLPGAPVVGLLVMRALVGGRNRSVASQHLVAMASRWAWLWAATTAVWMVLTVAGLYGGSVLDVPLGDNLVTVMASSEAVRGQFTVLWVALLIACFGSRLGNWRESLGLVVLTAAALLGAAPQGAAAAGHGHDAGQPLVLVVAAVQLLAVALWLGALAAVPHLRTPAYQLRYHLTRFGDLVSAAAVLLGVSGVAAGLLLPAGAGGTATALGVAQLSAIALVAGVGYRHRRRTVEVMTNGHALALLALVVGEVIVMGAVVMVGFLLPVAG